METGSSNPLPILNTARQGLADAFVRWRPLPAASTPSPDSGRGAGLRRLLSSRWVLWGLAIIVFVLSAESDPDLRLGNKIATGALSAAPVLVVTWDVLAAWRVALLGGAVLAVLGTGQGSPWGLPVLAGVVLVWLTVLVATRYDRPVAWWAWASVALLVTVGSQRGQDGAIPWLIVVGLLAIVTDAVHARRAATRALSQEHEATALERARRVGAEERARIARELHDVVAHHMSMVAVRAETAPYRLSDLPREVATEFTEISQAARQSLDEIRALLGVLRSDEVPLSPQPNLEGIEEMLEIIRRAGVEVDLEILGGRKPLLGVVEAAAYRILQESLSNVARHAPGSRARVVIEYFPDRLRIEVGNLVEGGVAEIGHGITGMRERAAAWAAHLRPHCCPMGGSLSRLPCRWTRDPGLVVDDQAMVREGFSALLGAQDDIEVVGQAEDGREAVAAASRLAPDVILMDVRMPKLDGLAATRTILEQAGEATRVVMLTTFDLDEYVYEAIRAGASGFLLKDAPASTLVEAVRVVAAGDALLAPSVTRRLINDLSRRPVTVSPTRLEVLTDREQEVLVQVARGLSNAEIAETLFISEQTVKTHVSRILTKLGLRDRAQAVVVFYESGVAL